MISENYITYVYNVSIFRDEGIHVTPNVKDCLFQRSTNNKLFLLHIFSRLDIISYIVSSSY